MTELEAQQYLESTITCSECGTRKIYRKRSFNSTMARQLIYLYKYFRDPSVYANLGVHSHDSEGDWVHASRFFKALKLERESAKLRHWDLIEEKSESKTDGNPHAGYFRITDYGSKVAQGKQRVWKYIITLNHKGGSLGVVETESLTIQQALGNGFDYSKEIV